MMEVELETEVEEWVDSLTDAKYANLLVQIDRLERMGATIREPWSKSLGDGLYELRFDIDRVAWRIAYFFAPNRRAVLLTIFRKQRNNERHEVQRARQAMRRCIAEHEHGERNEP
jgi:hypothetical protein